MVMEELEEIWKWRCRVVWPWRKASFLHGLTSMALSRSRDVYENMSKINVWPWRKASFLHGLTSSSSTYTKVKVQPGLMSD